MKKIKVSELRKSLSVGDIIFLKNYKKPSFKFAHKAICFLDNGPEKDKLLVTRWKNCAQKTLDPETIVYIPKTLL